jgi:predicted amidohydrolase
MEDRGNIKLNIESAYDSIVQTRADFFVLPEFFAIPEGDFKKKYTPEECWLQTGKPALEMLKKASRLFDGYIIGGTVIEKGAGHYYNTCPVFKSGEFVTGHRKINLVADDLELGISPGRESTTFETPWGSVGLLICADMILKDLVRKTASNADIVFIPMSLTDPEHPKYEGHPVATKIAKDYDVIVVGVSRVSTFSGVKITSKSAVVTPDEIVFDALFDEKLAIVEI